VYTSGLLLTLCDDPELAEHALAELAAAGSFTLGESSGPCRPAVLEAADAKSAHDWHDWASAVPGVESMEVVFVHWEDAEAEVSDAGF